MKVGQTYTIEPMINAGIVSFSFSFKNNEPVSWRTLQQMVTS